MSSRNITREEFAGTTVSVMSPDFAHSEKPKWKCRFNGEDIVAEITDNDFLTQVGNYEVKFDAGTTLKCDMQVETTINLDNPNRKPIRKFFVTYVWEWSDGRHVVTTTKRYRRQNEKE